MLDTNTDISDFDYYFYSCSIQTAIKQGRSISSSSDCFGVTVQTCVIRDLGVSSRNSMGIV
jgi:hypothetical protein